MLPEKKYDNDAFYAMKTWQQRMQRKPSFTNKLSKRIQNRINRWIPEKVHRFITGAIKEMTGAMISGAGLITPSPLQNESLENREKSAVVVEHLGDVYLKMGQIQEAVKFWQQALELDKNNLNLKRKIEMYPNEN